MDGSWVAVATAGIGALAALGGAALGGWLSDRGARRRTVVEAVGVLTSYTAQAEMTRSMFDLLDGGDPENLRWRADRDLERMHELHQAVASLRALGSKEVSRRAEDLYIWISERAGNWDHEETTRHLEEANRALLAAVSPSSRRRRGASARSTGTQGQGAANRKTNQ